MIFRVSHIYLPGVVDVTGGGPNVVFCAAPKTGPGGFWGVPNDGLDDRGAPKAGTEVWVDPNAGAVVWGVPNTGVEVCCAPKAGVADGWDAPNCGFVEAEPNAGAVEPNPPTVLIGLPKLGILEEVPNEGVELLLLNKVDVCWVDPNVVELVVGLAELAPNTNEEPVEVDVTVAAALPNTVPDDILDPVELNIELVVVWGTALNPVVELAGAPPIKHNRFVWDFIRKMFIRTTV